MISSEEFTKIFFNYWKNSYKAIESFSPSTSSDDSEKTTYTRNSLPNSISDGMAYLVTQGLMQYAKITPRNSSGLELSPLFPGGILKLASTTFLPSPYPASQFKFAKELAIPFNSLISTLSCNPKWLVEQLSPIAEVDDFIANLVGICKRIYINGGKDFTKDIRMYITRSDYMTDTKKESYADSNGENTIAQSDSKKNEENIHISLHLKQIELNTVSISCHSYVDSLAPLHKVQLQKLLHTHNKSAFATGEETFKVTQELLSSVSIPNYPLENFASTFNEAHNLYMEKFHPTNPLSVLWVVDSADLNEVDQRQLAFKVESVYGINIIRATMNEMYQMKMNGAFFSQPCTQNDKVEDSQFENSTHNIVHSENENSEKFQNSEQKGYSPYRLFMKETNGTWANPSEVVHEISIFYLRSGYAPHHFKGASDWEIFEWIEGSEAIKCPAVPTLLSGMKKIQQTWCKEDVLEQFTSEADTIKKCFAYQVDMNDDSDQAQAIFADAIQNPKNYVLKPQREGGGNNLHGEDLKNNIIEFLNEKASYKQHRNQDKGSESQSNKFKSQPTSGFILMEKIRPPALPTMHFRSPYPSDQQPLPHTKIACQPSVTELGIYGTAVFDGEKEYMNQFSGYLMRTKSAEEDEGGFVTGVSSIDTPFIYDDSNNPSLVKKLLEDI